MNWLMKDRPAGISVKTCSSKGPTADVRSIFINELVLEMNFEINCFIITNETLWNERGELKLVCEPDLPMAWNNFYLGLIGRFNTHAHLGMSDINEAATSNYCF